MCLEYDIHLSHHVSCLSKFNAPIVIFLELFDHPLFLQLAQDGLVFFVRAITDMKGVWLTQGDTGLYKLPHSRTEGLKVTLQYPRATLVLGLKLRRHCGGGRSVKTERDREAKCVIKIRNRKGRSSFIDIPQKRATMKTMVK